MKARIGAGFNDRFAHDRDRDRDHYEFESVGLIKAGLGFHGFTEGEESSLNHS